MIVQDRLGDATCPELDTAVARLGTALDESMRVGADSTGAHKAASDFYAKETGFWTKSWASWGTACQNSVNESERLLAALNKEIASAKGTIIIGTDPNLTPYIPNPGQALGDFKWIIVGVAGLGLLWVFGPYVKTMLGFKSKGSR